MSSDAKRESERNFQDWIVKKGLHPNHEFRQQPVVDAIVEAYAQGAEDAWKACSDLADESKAELKNAVSHALIDANNGNLRGCQERLRIILDDLNTEKP